LKNNEEEDFEKLMNEIKAEDTKVFGGQQNLENEIKANVKLPKKSFKNTKADEALEFDNNENPEITKIDDAEKYINDNKTKKRLRFAEEKKANKSSEITPKEETEENVNEEDINEIEAEVAKAEEIEKNGLVYEYRENR
jgi:hypothetical protein